jgi:hypothetical protein
MLLEYLDLEIEGLEILRIMIKEFEDLGFRVHWPSRDPACGALYLL